MTGVGMILLAAAVSVTCARVPAGRAMRAGFAAGSGHAAKLLSRWLCRPTFRAGSWWVPVCVPLLWVGPGVFGAVVLVVRTVRRVLADRTAQRRRSDAAAALLNGLDAVIAELGAGAHPAAAVEAAVSECQGDVVQAFAACAGRCRLGGGAAAGLRLPDSVISVELERLACAWELAECHGLALADLLATVRSDIGSRLRFRERTAATVAGARASALVLAGLPVLGVVLGELMGARPLRLLLGRGPGQALLLAGVGLVCAGVSWTEAMVRRVSR